MSKKWYGEISNRIEENKNYTGREIQVGDDITEYSWSDRHCYYVTRVIDQKHIFVKPYEVCADHSKEGGMGHQNWLYFKTCREMQEYLNDCIDKGLIKYEGCKKTNLDDVKENGETELVYRYNHWYVKNTYWYGIKLDKPSYHKINISFGVRDYYYDWSF